LREKGKKAKILGKESKEAAIEKWKRASLVDPMWN